MICQNCADEVDGYHSSGLCRRCRDEEIRELEWKIRCLDNDEE